MPVGSKDAGPAGNEAEDADAELMLRLQRGDEAAFEILVRRWQDRVVSLAYRYLGSAADAEDLAQEVFLRVYRARETYQPTARFSTWIYRVTANASFNWLRGRRVRRNVSREMPEGPEGPEGGAREVADPEAPNPAEALEKEELAAVLRRIVDSLPERQRMAILLNKYEDLPYEAVAEAMELTVMAVKSLLTRARVNIKDALVPYLEEGTAPGPREESV